MKKSEELEAVDLLSGSFLEDDVNSGMFPAMFVYILASEDASEPLTEPGLGAGNPFSARTRSRLSCLVALTHIKLSRRGLGIPTPTWRAGSGSFFNSSRHY